MPGMIRTGRHVRRRPCSCTRATLVTNNIREFSRVPELKLEDWTALP
ncbi:MAG: hypothetical protein R3D34_11325 [Nitratireductor sp.]